MRKQRLWHLTYVLLVLAVIQFGGSCPPSTTTQPTTNPSTTNQNPMANAGADQTVTAGSVVTLQGTGTDPDGDTLSFAWTQTVGAAVTITNANSAVATFTSAATAAALTF